MSLHRLLLAATALALLGPPVTPPAYASSAAPDGLVACVKDPVADVIARYPKGREDLTKAVARLVAAQPCVADYVIAAAETASPAIAAALASGLAQGVAVLVISDPGTARQIRVAVYQSGNPSFATVFSIAYSVALTASPAALASSDDSGLPAYSAPLGNTTVSPH